ncbi:MAG TPA: ABC transporter ATP-binding protein [Hydrogenophaga sp.]|uniref:ABC transporter ATP-binding protein n=1 Tax=Hydrogenophaga sp. TaxID=1904254 RepID=UPI0008C72814|nr:ABC transporter ATP-binding protein [Hydrogenophaga sp.]MBW8467684.1 ABC transporter ATP-binding protein [Thiobacillus sp.]OGA74490.1 MAG: ABC transporter ATP-binding protein [Burkholderiales bacterium GWE1_65_30]OGA89498.1 MAG: ABC transporter ATP-binding protein [Burkholderiales bacterium GWF1_66_17]OGB30052.1 MAG: ABC transporter ATP-binding protein [Burkholderiales bacterium RIFCSPLOWO2_02_FULL_66_35]PKO75012.1 MAG: ABC transporter ATP-binding protein [Betaproteobacteria bacterium HGW-B
MFLNVSQLSVRYAGQQPAAVDGVSFGLRAGDIGVLIGPSGCGKTTLLRAVAGLERASSGSITLQGETVSDGQHHMPAEQRRIGMVFQDYALFPHLDIARNVGFGIAKLSRNEREKRVAEVLKLVGLDGMQARYPHELSGGQQQRVALARALAPRPRLLLLDEPFSNLDVDLRERLAHEVRAILKAAGATALFVTHDQLEAFAIGDVIGVMHQGHLHQWDDAYALYHRPATRFVAEFIGHGVFAPAQIRLVGNEVSVQTPLGALHDVEECPLPSAYESGLCDVLLRADDIVHDDLAPAKAQIVRKAFRGSEFLYTLRLASGETLMTHVPSHHNHAVGEWIGIRAEVDHVVTFARGASATSPPAPGARKPPVDAPL